MNTELKNAVKAADLKAQYDARVKRLVGHKRVLAQILIKTVDEFKGMNPKTVANCIEGTPYISTVPVEPGLTNAVLDKNGQRIVGFNTKVRRSTKDWRDLILFFMCGRRMVCRRSLLT